MDKYHVHLFTWGPVLVTSPIMEEYFLQQ